MAQKSSTPTPAGFEGTIKFKLNLVGEQAEQLAAMMPIPKAFEYQFLGGNMRMLTDQAKLSEMLYFPKTKKAFMMERQNKKAFEIKTELSSSKASDLPKVTETTETATIAGYKCKKYILQGYNKALKMTLTQTVWATDAIKAKMPDVESNNFIPKGIKGFPLKIELPIMLFTLELEAIGVDKQKPDANLFQVPKDFKVEAYDPKVQGF